MDNVFKALASLLISFIVPACFAVNNAATATSINNIWLHEQKGFFRFSFDSIKMPQHMQNVGLLGINYFADLTPFLYTGISGYGSITGTQGGLFVLGIAGGLHHELIPHWWGDIGMFAGGGGGRSSLVGGGLMLRPHAGIAYSWRWGRLGLHYSYIDFPSGLISSSQIGLDFDMPVDFYYVSSEAANNGVYDISQIHLLNGLFPAFQRNDFGLLIQSYRQQPGTKNVNGQTEDGTINLVGAELDHYLTDHTFWWVKTSGAFGGISNGYMDLLGGLGYHWILASNGFALVPQFGLGAGGGGNVDTGGGFLVQPQLGAELPLASNFAARISGGYLWAPDGNLKAFTATGMLIYHLDIVTSGRNTLSSINNYFAIQRWRLHIFNQTYFHPQRASSDINSAINLIAVQADQSLNPYFFFSYQAASAYSGNHAGGYATGMIGPGLQTTAFYRQHIKFFAELLAGAGGGGGLALAGGALIEPVLGIHYAITPGIGLVVSASEIKAISSSLNTPVLNAGITINFGTLNREA